MISEGEVASWRFPPGTNWVLFYPHVDTTPLLRATLAHRSRAEGQISVCQLWERYLSFSFNQFIKRRLQFLRHVGWMTPTTPKATDRRLFESRAAPPKPQRWKTPSWRQGLEVRLGLRQLNGGRSSNNHCVLRAACRVALNTSDLEAVETHSAATLAANSGCQLKGDATRGWSGDGRRETQQLTRRHVHNGAFLRAFTDLQIGRIDGKNKKKRWNVRLTSKRRSDSICPSYESLLSINLGANLGQWYLHSSVAKK